MQLQDDLNYQQCAAIVADILLKYSPQVLPKIEAEKAAKSVQAVKNAEPTKSKRVNAKVKKK